MREAKTGSMVVTSDHISFVDSFSRNVMSCFVYEVVFLHDSSMMLSRWRFFPCALLTCIQIKRLERNGSQDLVVHSEVISLLIPQHVTVCVYYMFLTSNTARAAPLRRLCSIRDTRRPQRQPARLCCRCIEGVLRFVIRWVEKLC